MVIGALSYVFFATCDYNGNGINHAVIPSQCIGIECIPEDITGTERCGFNTTTLPHRTDYVLLGYN